MLTISTYAIHSQFLNTRTLTRVVTHTHTHTHAHKRGHLSFWLHPSYTNTRTYTHAHAHTHPASLTYTRTTHTHTQASRTMPTSVSTASLSGPLLSLDLKSPPTHSLTNLQGRQLCLCCSTRVPAFLLLPRTCPRTSLVRPLCRRSSERSACFCRAP